MATGDVHVLYRAETGHWVVKEEGSNVSTLHPSKSEAVSAGRVRALSCGNGAELLVHARDSVSDHAEQVSVAVPARSVHLT